MKKIKLLVAFILVTILCLSVCSGCVLKKEPVIVPTTQTPVPTPSATAVPVTPLPTATPTVLFMPDIDISDKNYNVGYEQLEFLVGSKNYIVDFSTLEDSLESFTANNIHFAGELLVKGKTIVPLILNFPFATIKVEGEFEKLTLTSGENTNVFSKDAKVKDVTINGGNIVVSNNATIEKLKVESESTKISMSENSRLKLVASDKDVSVTVNDASVLTLILNSSASQITVNQNSKNNCVVEKDGELNTNIVVVPKSSENKLLIVDVSIAEKITINKSSSTETIDKFFDTSSLTSENIETVKNTVKEFAIVEENYLVPKFLNSADYESNVGDVKNSIPYRDAMSFDANKTFKQSDLTNSLLNTTYFIKIDNSKLDFLSNMDTMTIFKNGIAVSTFVYSDGSFSSNANNFNLGQYFDTNSVYLALDIPFAINDAAGIFRAANANYYIEFKGATNSFKLNLQKNYSSLKIEKKNSIDVSTFEMLQSVLRDSNIKSINIVGNIDVTDMILVDTGVEVAKGLDGKLTIVSDKTVVVLNGGKLQEDLISKTTVTVTKLFGVAYYSSFEHALTFADNGETINLKEGEYSLSNNSQIINKAISIKGQGADKTKITSPIKYALPNRVDKVAQNKVVLDGINFYNDGDTSKHYGIKENIVAGKPTTYTILIKYMLDVSTSNTFSETAGRENELDALIIQNCYFETMAPLSYGINLDDKTNITLERSKFITSKKDASSPEGYFQHLVAFPPSGKKHLNSKHVVKNNTFASKFVYGFYFADKIDMSNNNITSTSDDNDLALVAATKQEEIDGAVKVSVVLNKTVNKLVTTNASPVLLHMYASVESANYDSITGNITNNIFSGMQSVVRLYNLDYTKNAYGFIFRNNKMSNIGTPLNLSSFSYSGGGALLSEVMHASNTIVDKKPDYKNVVAFLESGGILEIDKNMEVKRGGIPPKGKDQGILYYSFGGKDEPKAIFKVTENSKKAEGTYYLPHTCKDVPCTHTADNDKIFAYTKLPNLLYDKTESYENEVGNYIYLGKHIVITNTYNNKLVDGQVVSTNPSFIAHTFVKEDTGELYVVPFTVLAENVVLIKAQAGALTIDEKYFNIFYGTGITRDDSNNSVALTSKASVDIDINNVLDEKFKTLIISEGGVSTDNYEGAYQIIVPTGGTIRNLNIIGDVENIIINASIDNVSIRSKSMVNLTIEKLAGKVKFIEATGGQSVINNYGKIEGKAVATHNIGISAESKAVINNYGVITSSVYVGGWSGNAGARVSSLKASGSVINNYNYINTINLFGQATVNNGESDKVSVYNLNQPQNVKNFASDTAYTTESPFAPVINKFAVTAHVENYLVSRDALSANSVVNNYGRMANYSDGAISISAKTEFNNYGVIGVAGRNKNYNLTENGGKPSSLGTANDANNYGGVVTIGYAGYYDYSRGTKFVNKGTIYYASALARTSSGVAEARLPQAPIRVNGMNKEAMSSTNIKERYSGKPNEISFVNEGILYGGMSDPFESTNTLKMSFTNEKGGIVTLVNYKLFYSNIDAVTNKGVVWVENKKHLAGDTGNLSNPIKNEESGIIVTDKPEALG